MNTKPGQLLVVFVVGLSLIPQDASAADKLIELIPDDAFAAVYVARPQRALPPTLIKPFCEAALPDAADAGKLIEAVKRIPGAFLVGLIPPPVSRKNDLPDVFVAMDISTLQGSFDDLVEKSLLPAVRVLLEIPETDQLKLDKSNNATRIVQQPGDKTVFAYAVKDKTAFGATKPQLALRWANGEWPEKRWTARPGIKRMLNGLPKTASIRAFVNPLPLWEYLKADSPPKNSPEALALKVLSPEDIRAGAVDLTWEKSVLSARVTVMLADECQGLARVLARPATKAQVLGVFPEDFVAVGRIGWGSASDVVNGAYALTDAFDETISAEYREELAEFKKETGVNWDTGILGNLAGEMALGVRVDFSRQEPIAYVLVFPLADAAGFRSESDKLIAHYKLEFEELEQDGVTVRSVAAAPPSPRNGITTSMPGEDIFQTFCWAIENGLLITGNSPEAIAGVARQAGKGKPAEPLSANLQACYSDLGEPNHVALMFDMGRLYQNVPMIAVAAPSPWRSFLAEGTIGLSVGVKERMAWLDLRWSLEAPGSREKSTTKPASNRPAASELAVILARSFGESVKVARRLAKRVVSSANMRNVGQALYIYAEAHKGAFPESLTELLRAEADVITFNTLTSPYDNRGPKSIDEVEKKAYVIYRPGFTTSGAPNEILLAEREIHDGGANFLFLDGHVEWVPEPRASELLEQIRSGAAEVRI